MSADATFNLGYAYWDEQDGQASVYWLNEAVRLDPADADAHFVLAAALDATGAGTEGGRERELARRLSAGYEEGESGPSATGVPKGLERVAPSSSVPRRAAPTPCWLRPSSASNGRWRRSISIAAADFTSARTTGTRSSNCAARFTCRPTKPRRTCSSDAIHLRAGRTRDAIESLKISLWSEETAEGHEALGEAYLLEKNSAAGARRGRARPGAETWLPGGHAAVEAGGSGAAPS